MSSNTHSDSMKYWWIDYPWRYIQTNLREIDMLDIDAKKYVEELKKFNATIAMINTSGILASYNTRLKYHYQNPYLKGDSLEKIIDECHKAGIKVIARTDFSKIRRVIYEQHPEWAYVSPEGKIVDYNGNIHACINGGFQREYKLEILKETLETLNVDGLFFNMGGYQESDYSYNYYGICQCESCKKRFKEMYGLELPEKADMNDPAYRKYLVFKEKTVDEDYRRVCEFVHSIRPDLLICSDFTRDTGYIREEANTALDRPLPHWQYSASENSKWIRGSYPGFRASTCDVDFIDFPVRHVAVSPAQQELRLAQSLANGAGLDYYIIGRLDNHEDKSGFERVKKMFKFHKDNEQYYCQPESIAYIALVCSDRKSAEYRGWYRALTEGHFLFDVIITKRLSKVDLSKYSMLVLPDVRYISDETAQLVDSFAQNGGTIIYTGQTGFYDECYEKREFPALRSMGLDKFLIERSDCRSAMFKIRDDEYEFLGRFGRGEKLIYLDGSYIFNDYNPSFSKKLAYIPPHPFGPPEKCYYSQVTDLPGFVCGSFGKGKTVYIPWYPGKLLYRQGYLNTWNFMVSLLEYYGDDFRVKGEISPMVETTVQADKEKSYYLLSLVNTNGHYGVSFFDPVPIYGLTCQIKVDKRPAKVINLIDGQPLDYKYDDAGGWLSIKFKKTEIYDCAAIHF